MFIFTLALNNILPYCVLIFMAYTHFGYKTYMIGSYFDFLSMSYNLRKSVHDTCAILTKTIFKASMETLAGL